MFKIQQPLFPVSRLAVFSTWSMVPWSSNYFYNFHGVCQHQHLLLKHNVWFYPDDVFCPVTAVKYMN